MCLCMIAAADIIKQSADMNIEDGSAEKDEILWKYCIVSLKLGVRLGHMYTKVLKFLAPAV